MEVLDPSTATITKTIHILNASGIAAYPTETFYALGARYDHPEAIHRIYDLKKRPPDKALPVIISDRSQLSYLITSLPKIAEILMDQFWPGPLTLILPALPGLADGIVYERKIAVRIPGPSFALDLVRAAGFPITSTSANPSGLPPATSAKMITDYFPYGIDLLINGDTTKAISPSTIVDLCDKVPRIVRAGVIPSEVVMKILS